LSRCLYFVVLDDVVDITALVSGQHAAAQWHATAARMMHMDNRGAPTKSVQYSPPLDFIVAKCAADSVCCEHSSNLARLLCAEIHALTNGDAVSFSMVTGL
jgi:hypothetical protein